MEFHLSLIFHPSFHQFCCHSCLKRVKVVRAKRITVRFNSQPNAPVSIWRMWGETSLSSKHGWNIHLTFLRLANADFKLNWHFFVADLRVHNWHSVEGNEQEIRTFSTSDELKYKHALYHLQTKELEWKLFKITTNKRAIAKGVHLSYQRTLMSHWRANDIYLLLLTCFLQHKIFLSQKTMYFFINKISSIICLVLLYGLQ